MKVVTAAEMAAIERASERAGVSTDTLMEHAGLAVAQLARELLGGAAGRRIVTLAGPGNNGADGLVAARHLCRWGAESVGYLAAPRPAADPKLRLALDYGVAVYRIEDDPGRQRLERLLASAELVIDAVLGTGASRPLSGALREVMLRVGARGATRLPPPSVSVHPATGSGRTETDGYPSASEALDEGEATPVRPEPGGGRAGGAGALLLALDLPTGLNADTGAVDAAGPPADVTAALGYPKAGLLRFPGAEYAGRLRILDIGIPAGLPEEAAVDLELLTPQWVAQRRPPRPPEAHKGAFGHALIIAGSRRYVGAAYLAAQAAVRSGAGLTTLASPQSVYPINAARSAEAIHRPLPEDAEGRIDASAAALLRGEIGRFSAVAIGCGMGRYDGGAALLERLLFSGEPGGGAAAGGDGDGGGDAAADGRPVLPIPVLIDADGLNNLSQIADWPERARPPLVLTPHPGEMSTLTGRPVAEIQADRVGAARYWAERWNAVVLLKGAHSVIAAPGRPALLLAAANPGLATGGTGDVLSGLIAGLLAQGLPPFEAAGCGAWLHAAAGAAAAARRGAAATAAGDLLDLIGN